MDQEKTPEVQPDQTPMTQVLQTGAGPISALIDKTSPDFKEKLSGKLESILKRSIEQMMSTFNDDEVEQRLASARAVSTTGRLGLSDDQMSIIDEHVKAMRQEVRQRTVLGSAVTGSFGFLGQFADLPAFYLYAIRTLGDVSISYGFDPRLEREQLFILELLRIGHVPGRKKRLVQLDSLTQKAHVRSLVCPFGSGDLGGLQADRRPPRHPQDGCDDSPGGCGGERRPQLASDGQHSGYRQPRLQE